MLMQPLICAAHPCWDPGCTQHPIRPDKTPPDLLPAAALLPLASTQPSSERDYNNLILASALVIVVALTCLMSYYQVGGVL
jgi:hypothetical protein